MRRIGFAAEGQPRTVLRSGELDVRPPLGIDQAKQDSLRISCAVRHHGRRMDLDAGANSSRIVRDLEPATAEHRSDAVHLDRSEQKAESQEAHLDLRQKKHQKHKIENRENDEKPLKRHNPPPPDQIFMWAAW